MPPRDKVGIDAIEKLQRKLTALPDYRPREVTKTEAVRLLLPEIHALQKRGYSLSAIAGLLSEDGVAVSAMTLKAYVKQAGDRTRVRKGASVRHKTAVRGEAARKPGVPPSEADDGEPTEAAQASKATIPGPKPSSIVSSAEPSGGVERVKRKTKEEPNPSVARPNNERTKENPSATVGRRSAFVVRDDTEDL